MGIRISELQDLVGFGERLQFVLNYKNKVLTGLYGLEPLDYSSVFES